MLDAYGQYPQRALFQIINLSEKKKKPILDFKPTVWQDGVKPTVHHIDCVANTVHIC